MSMFCYIPLGLVRRERFLLAPKLRYTDPQRSRIFPYLDAWVRMIEDQLGSFTIWEAEPTLSTAE